MCHLEEVPLVILSAILCFATNHPNSMVVVFSFAEMSLMGR